METESNSSQTRKPQVSPQVHYRKDDLVGSAEVCTRLGVSRQTLDIYMNMPKYGFPEPEATLATGPVWRWGTINNWDRENRKNPKIRKTPN